MLNVWKMLVRECFKRIIGVAWKTLKFKRSSQIWVIKFGKFILHFQVHKIYNPKNFQNACKIHSTFSNS